MEGRVMQKEVGPSLLCHPPRGCPASPLQKEVGPSIQCHPLKPCPASDSETLVEE